MGSNRSLTSYIEDHEEDEAKQYIEEELGFALPKANRDRIIVKIYIRPEELSTFENDKGETVSIYMPEIILNGDKYKNFAALVLSVGEQCFSGEEYKDCGPSCKVGDWVTIARNDGGQQYIYRGIAVQDIPVRAMLSVIEDPNYVERLN